MNMTIQVPSIKCEGCADTITQEIQVHDENAKVSVDIENKTVEVDSDMSESSVKQAIEIAGHKVAE